jgi:uncharacterized repeat protein (TIGR01451 family)
MRVCWERSVRLALVVALTAVAVAAVLATGARGEQAASEVRALQHGFLDAGAGHVCAVLASGSVRCWGQGGNGQLGYSNTDTIGDDELPASVGLVDLGAGRSARAITGGSQFTCAVLDNGSVRCWGEGSNGRLGYGNTNDIGDNETPGSVGPVDLGLGRSARAISAGVSHTCAVLDDGSVRCWGENFDGRLGYGNTNAIGDDESPGSVGPVDLGVGRSARAISAGFEHTCALLDDGSVRCWGFGGNGRLGYGNTNNIGDNETPGSVGPVDLGAGRTARAISAGFQHTCALLDDATVRCWGNGGNGRLGYGNTTTIGDDEAPGSAGPVDVGAGRSARAITAANGHTCALLDNGAVRCWGVGVDGRLGYGSTVTIGDDEAPGSVGPVNLGAGRSARAISADGQHTCAVLDDGSVRCWGLSDTGQLGYGNLDTIGDNETPGQVGPVHLNGLIVAAVGDLSLGMTVDAPARQVGEQATFTLTLTNGGPDAAGGVSVGAALPAGLALVSASPSQGTYDAATGVWAVGAVAVGAPATLTLVTRVDAAGVLTNTAEVVDAGVPDPDSTPGNAAAGEDDRAAASVTATVPPEVIDDVVAPVVDVTGVPRTRKLRRFRKGVRPTATPDEPASITMELLTTARSAGARKVRGAAAGPFNLTLDRRSFPLGAGARTARLKPPRRLLGKARRFRARVRVTAIDAAGNRAVVNRNIRVRR